MKKTKKSEEMGRRKREWGRGGERGGRGDIEEKRHKKNSNSDHYMTDLY